MLSRSALNACDLSHAGSAFHVREALCSTVRHQESAELARDDSVARTARKYTHTRANRAVTHLHASWFVVSNGRMKAGDAVSADALVGESQEGAVGELELSNLTIPSLLCGSTLADGAQDRCGMRFFCTRKS